MPKKRLSPTVSESAPEPLSSALMRSAFIVESSDDAIIAKTLDGRIVSWNPGAERIYGYTAEEAVERPISLLAPGDRADEIPVILDRIARGERVAHYETTRICKDGTPIHVSLTVSPIRDQAGKIIGASTIARDITSQKLAELELSAMVRRQALVAELGQKALGGALPKSLTEESVVLVAQGYPGSSCGVFVRDAPTGSFRLIAGSTAPKPDGPSLGPSELPQSLGASVFEGKSPVVVERLDVPREGEPADPSAQRSGMFAVLPESPPTRFLAVLSPRAGAFRERDGFFLQSVANILALAFERKWAEENRIRLLEGLMTAQEQERRRLARELHDETGQSMTSLLVGLRLVSDAKSLKDARERADHLRKLASMTLDNIGRLARGLHPSLLDDLGLAAALNRHAVDYGAAHHVQVSVEARGVDQDDISPTVRIALYRIFQEALTNAARHARANRVVVTLDRTNRTIELEVADDGVGFDVDATLREPSGSFHLGLLGIRERAALLGGHVVIRSEPGRGTTVRAVIPCPPPTAVSSSSSD